MTFPMAWRTAPPPADSFRVLNGGIVQTPRQGVSNTDALFSKAAGHRAVMDQTGLSAALLLREIERRGLAAPAAAPGPTPQPRAAAAPPAAPPAGGGGGGGRGTNRNYSVWGGYLNNFFDGGAGTEAAGRQLLFAPFAGHVRRALTGQEVFGHTITGDQALVAERALAGLVAGGVGTAGLLAAIDGLNGPDQTPGTIPLY